MSPSLVRSRSLFVVSLFLFILPFLPPFPLSLEKKKKELFVVFCASLFPCFSSSIFISIPFSFYPSLSFYSPTFSSLFTLFYFFPTFFLFCFSFQPPPLVFFHIKRREELNKYMRKAVNTRKNLQHIYYLIYLTRKDHADVDPITTTNTDN